MKRPNPFRLLITLAGISLLSTASALVADDTTNTAVPPDNAANNANDRNSNSVTPIDQSEDNADIQITAKIRRAITRDKSISVDGHNVKIITTKDHVVYLRGPVANDAECKKIEAIAKRRAGGYTVKNELKSQTTGN
jgi:hyperosmotically inducible protein